MERHSSSYALSWLAGHLFLGVTRREHDWVFEFEHDAKIVVGTLWRFLDGGCICRTSEDDAQLFGHPAQVDAAAELNQHIAGELLVSVRLCQGTLDLDLEFPEGRVLQIIPTSAGYEAWSAFGSSGQYIAMRGGQLA